LNAPYSWLQWLKELSYTGKYSRHYMNKIIIATTCSACCLTQNYLVRIVSTSSCSLSSNILASNPGNCTVQSCQNTGLQVFMTAPNIPITNTLCVSTHMPVQSKYSLFPLAKCYVCHPFCKIQPYESYTRLHQGFLHDLIGTLSFLQAGGFWRWCHWTNYFTIISNIWCRSYQLGLEPTLMDYEEWWLSSLICRPKQPVNTKY